MDKVLMSWFPLVSTVTPCSTDGSYSTWAWPCKPAVSAGKAVFLPGQK